jgi:tight adherence protein B
MPFIPYLPAFVAITSGLLALAFFIIAARVMMRDRLAVVQRISGMIGKTQPDRPIKINKNKRARHPFSQAIANELSNAGIKMRANEFIVIWVFASLILPIMFYLVNMHPLSVLAAAVFGVVLPPLLVHQRKKKRLIVFEKQLGEALVLIGNCLRAGMTFQQAMGNVAEDMPDPIGREFSRTVREIHLGSNVDDALEHMAERVKSLDLTLTVSAIQIQRQVGGNLLDVLENISVTIKDRLKIKDDIRVLTATGRSSGVIVGSIPLIIGGLLALINPEYMMTFFNTRAGNTMLAVAAGMEILGFLIIRKIVDVKY